MRSHRIIRPVLAASLLALFALGITPKLALHALVAHHTDSHLLQHGKADQYNTAGFHCDTDNQVVELPFLHYSFTVRLGIPPIVPAHPSTPLFASITGAHPLFGLRGPPAAAVC